jgi:hypothetical protein
VPRFVAIALIAMNPKKYRLDDISYDLPLDMQKDINLWPIQERFAIGT